ncbi:hypothetical protein BGW42_005932 [Actinomortierella wolfii]|nr:hypothetical protein BGW42_005932 [Actinomortierella wolfii]
MDENLRANGFSNYTDDKGNVLFQEELLKRAEYMTTVVFPGIEKKSQRTRKTMIERFNSSVLLNEFPNGAKVMAIDPIRDGKFAPRYEGPYTVHSRSRSGAYILRDGTGEILKRKFAPSQLKMVLDDLEDGEVFDVERIVDHRQIENGEYE